MDVTKKTQHALHDRPEFDLDALQDYSKMKEKLSMEVVSSERNDELLEKVPHKDLEDMAIVYRFVLDTGANDRSSILVTNQLLENYGITAEQLHNDAMEAIVNEYSRQMIIKKERPSVHKRLEKNLEQIKEQAKKIREHTKEITR